MNTMIMLVAAILPAALLWLYVWKKDAKPEPTKELVKAILCGVAICIPVAFVEQFVQTLLFGAGGGPVSVIGTTIDAFCVAAIPEEAAKLFVLWLILRKNPYFDEHYDGIVYAVCVGLGFAAVENVFYVFGEENWLSVAVSRALLAVPGHYAFAVLMGYYYSLYHFVERSTKNAVSILLVPVMAHGIYDALALSGQVNPLIGGIAFIVLIYFCVKMHKFAQGKLLDMIERDQKSPIC